MNNSVLLQEFRDTVKKRNGCILHSIAWDVCERRLKELKKVMTEEELRIAAVLDSRFA